MPKIPRRHDEHALRRAFGRVDARLRNQEGRIITGGGTSSGSASGVWDATRNGVQGNGVTDDTNAMRDLLAKMQPGDDLYVPPGAYVKVSGELVVPARIRISGGGTFYQAAANTPLLTIGPQASGSDIADVTLLGPQAAEYQAESKGVAIQGTSNLDRTAGVRLRGVTLQTWTFGVYAQYADQLRFVDCDLADLSYAGIHAFSCNHGQIRGCRIEDVIIAPGKTICYGVTLSREQVGTVENDPWSQDWKVVDNEVRNVPWEGIDTHAGIRITIADNQLWNCYIGVAVVSGPDELNQPVHGPRDCKVSNNLVVWPTDDGLSKAGIQVVGAQSGTDPATGCTVTSNTIRNYGFDGDSGSGGIVFYYTEGLTLVGNSILTPVYTGLNGFRANGGFAIVGNTVMDAWTNEVSLGYAGHTVIKGTENSFGVVEGNTIRTSGSKVADFVNSRGLTVGSGAASIIEVGHNDWRVPVPIFDGLSNRTSSRLHSPMFGVRGATPVAKPNLTGASSLGDTKQAGEDNGLWNYTP